MRSYDQYCGLARTLDVVGDRWSLLIIRELGIRPCRYRDLRDGLPGIATNLLSERLRQLEGDGVIERDEVPPPVGATVYRLTPHGERLLPILGDLARWGAGWMERGQGDDEFRGRWLVLAAAAIVGHDLGGVPDVRVRMDTGDETVVIEARDGRLRTAAGDRAPVDLIVQAAPETAVALLGGRLSPQAARRRRQAKIDGPPWAVQALAALGRLAAARGEGGAGTDGPNDRS